MNTIDSKEQNRTQCGTNRFRIVQVHPTLQCNLKCLHCYSSSGPELKSSLNVEYLKEALAALYEEGFNAVSISGGEPFMYRDLEELFQFTKELGYKNMVVTNAMLLKTARAKRILELTDLAAVSIDGKPDWHNHLRQSPVAFEKMLEGVEIIKEICPNFGFIHTVTPESIDDLFWLGAFTAEKGAKLLQLHPLEMSGRGKNLEAIKLHQDHLLKIYMLGFYLQQMYADQFFVQLDLLHKDIIKEKPDIVVPKPINTLSNPDLSDLLKNIIIDETGTILPYTHGFNKAYSIGNLKANADYQQMINSFMDRKSEAINDLCSSVLESILKSTSEDVFNWYEKITKRPPEKVASLIENAL